MHAALNRPLNLQWRWIAASLAVGLIVSWWTWLVSSMDALPPLTDAEAYWSVDIAHPYAHPYDRSLGGQLAFLYSPVVAQMLYPLTLLPFVAFYALLSAASLAALIWMVGPVLAALALLLPPVSHEIANGNIHLILAASIVAAIRQPALWAIPLLTKITPGVGVLWHVFRREWRAAMIAAAATLALIGLSAILAPRLWVEWVGVLLAADAAAGSVYVILSGWPLILRLCIAVGMIWLATRLDRPALVIVACLIALPAVWTNAMGMLVAVVPLWRTARRTT